MNKTIVAICAVMALLVVGGIVFVVLGVGDKSSGDQKETAEAPVTATVADTTGDTAATEPAEQNDTAVPVATATPTPVEVIDLSEPTPTEAPTATPTPAEENSEDQGCIGDDGLVW